MNGLAHHRRSKSITAVIAMLILALLFTTCSKDDSKDKGQLVARIGGDKIYLFDYIPPADSAKHLNMAPETKRKRLEDYVIRAIYIKEAYNKGFDKKEEVLDKLRAYEKSQMTQVVYNREIVDPLTSDENLRNLYEKLHTQIKARHILIAYDGVLRRPESAPTRSKEEAFSIAKNLRAQINSVDDFIRLADKYSEDSSAIEGGDLGFFEWGHMVDGFQNYAFSAPLNVVSEPIETEYGVHLIWVDSTKQVEQPPFEQMKEELKQRLTIISRGKMKVAADELVADLMEKAEVKIFDDKLEELSLLLNSHFREQRGKKYRLSPLETLDKMATVGDIAIYNGIGMKPDALKPIIMNPNFRVQIQRLEDPAFTRTLVDYVIKENLLSDHGYKAGYENDPELKSRIKDRLDALVLQEITKTEVNDKIDLSDESLLRFYDDNKDKYISKRSADIVEILVMGKTRADSIYNLVMQGEDMNNLAVDHTIRTKAKNNNGILENVEINNFGPVGKRAHEMFVGEISEPIKVGQRWSIIKVLAFHEPFYKPFEEVKNKIKSDARRYFLKENRENLTETLIEKYDPEYYYEAIGAVKSDA